MTVTRRFRTYSAVTCVLSLNIVLRIEARPNAIQRNNISVQNHETFKKLKKINDTPSAHLSATCTPDNLSRMNMLIPFNYIYYYWCDAFHIHTRICSEDHVTCLMARHLDMFPYYKTGNKTYKFEQLLQQAKNNSLTQKREDR